MARLTFFHIWILFGCDCLEKDAARFTHRKGLISVGDSSCKLCRALCEDALHFISQCSSLSDIRTPMLSSADRNVRDKLPYPSVFPIELKRLFWELTGSTTGLLRNFVLLSFMS